MSKAWGVFYLMTSSALMSAVVTSALINHFNEDDMSILKTEDSKKIATIEKLRNDLLRLIKIQNLAWIEVKKLRVGSKERDEMFDKIESLDGKSAQIKVRIDLIESGLINHDDTDIDYKNVINRMIDDELTKDNVD